MTEKQGDTVQTSIKRSDAVIRSVLNNKALLILLVLIIVSVFLTSGLFISPTNLASVSRQIVTIAMLGIGFTVVLASGSVDLSVGHMLSFTGVCYAMILTTAGKSFASIMSSGAAEALSLLVAIVLTMLIGAGSGLVNGLISEKLKLAPFIVTLATAQIFRGFASILSDGKAVTGLSDSALAIGQNSISSAPVLQYIPISLIITIILTLFISVLLYRTRYGRHVIATGGNPEAANVSGINISAIRISAFVIMGAFVAIGSIILTGRTSMAQPAAGAGMEMDAIAAVVIGGTPMSGGKARVGGTVFGCLVIGVMNNLLNLMGVSSFWQWVAKGLIIILAIVLDAQTDRFFNKLRKAS